MIFGDFSNIAHNKGLESIFLLEVMMIDEIHIFPTDNTPEILLNPEGIIMITGRGLHGNRTKVREQVIHWFDAYLSNPAEVT